MKHLPCVVLLPPSPSLPLLLLLLLTPLSRLPLLLPLLNLICFGEGRSLFSDRSFAQLLVAFLPMSRFISFITSQPHVFFSRVSISSSALNAASRARRTA